MVIRLFNLLLGSFLNFVVPKQCCFCGLFIDDDCCKNCYDGLCRIDQNSCCKVCGYPLPNIDNTGNFLDKNIRSVCPSCQSGKRFFNISRSAFQYQGKIRKSLMNLKFYFQTDQLRLIGREMYKIYQSMPKVDYVCFIPITKWKLFYKGNNHACLIAKSFFDILQKNNHEFNNNLKKTNEILLYDFLIKTNQSKQSKELTQEERWNKKYNFEINRKYLSPEKEKEFSNKKFLIIDDIMTTGATLNAASKIINCHFPKSKIYCLTFARTMLFS